MLCCNPLFVYTDVSSLVQDKETVDEFRARRKRARDQKLMQKFDTSDEGLVSLTTSQAIPTATP